MNRRALLASLSRSAQSAGLTVTLVRHGGRHDVYCIGELIIVIPRHREINERTARGIIAEVAHYIGRTR
jgi:mRNA interferase HicA